MPAWDGEQINVVDGRRIERTCIICRGSGDENVDDVHAPRRSCHYCGGRGRLPVSRLEMMWRDRRHGSGPGYDKGGKEQFVRIALDVPPEIAELIRAYIRASRTINGELSRPGFARIAILEMLDRHWPELPAAVDSTAVEAPAAIDPGG